MLEFQLFRVKVYVAKQGVLFGELKTPSEILTEAINSKLSLKSKKEVIWHIGNTTKIDDKGFYFRLGRTTKSKVGIYKDGNFADQEFETAPYTHALLDVELELLAVAKNNQLSPSVVGITNRLVGLLGEFAKMKVPPYSFEITELKDPKNFIYYLLKAKSISKFWIKYSKPNPFDSEEDFLKPMERMLQATYGSSGKTEIAGSELNPNPLERMVRSAAATGGDAGATLDDPDEGRRIKKRLKENPVIIKQEDLADQKQKRGLLEQIRHAYQRIRGKENK
jgi:hypothetical protein